MNSPIDYVEALTQALDDDDYVTAASTMAKRVEYTIGDQLIHGHRRWWPGTAPRQRWLTAYSNRSDTTTRSTGSWPVTASNAISDLEFLTPLDIDTSFNMR